MKRQIAALARPSGNVELTAPTLEILQARAHDALHSYVVARLGYDHQRATPLLNSLIFDIEDELNRVGGERGAEPQTPSTANVNPRGR